MNPVDEPIGDPVPPEEERLWSAAARLIGGELHVSAEDTQMAYGRLQATIRGVPDGSVVGATPQDERVARQSLRVIPQPLRGIVRTVFAEVTSRAVSALLGRKATPLTEAEIERLRGVVEQAETEDK